jgi:hypothetical protein
VFGIIHPSSVAKATLAEAAPAAVVDTTATEVPIVAAKRRGRPSGSRNRVKTEEPQPKRRRRRS